MNKKPILVSVFIFLSSTLFSLDFSTGYGLIIGANFDTLTSELSSASASAKQMYNQFDFGGLVFIDAKYAVLDVSFYGTSTTFYHNNALKQYTNVNEDYQLSGSSLGFGFYIKYPFDLTYTTSIFPIAGLKGNISLSQNFASDFDGINAKKGKSYGDAKDWSNVAIKAGVGIDIKIGQIMFFRAEFFGNYRFESGLDKAFIDVIKNGGNDTTYNDNLGIEVNILLGYTIGGNSGAVSTNTVNNGRANSNDIYYPK